MRIRRFLSGEEQALRSVFHSAVHTLATRDYSADQLEAWAPKQYDEVQWVERMRAIQPYVAEIDGSVVGYADLQPDGYIDHFYVNGLHAGRGVGTALMQHILLTASEHSIIELWSNVSLTAEPFFSKWDFFVETRRTVLVRGVSLANARMRKKLYPES